MALLKELEGRQKLAAQKATEEVAESVGPWRECTYVANANLWKLKDPITLVVYVRSKVFILIKYSWRQERDQTTTMWIFGGYLEHRGSFDFNIRWKEKRKKKKEPPTDIGNSA